MSLTDYEKLGAFYLGRDYDLASSQLQDSLLMYNAKDLTTHAVIVGMTGSGKTGLGITLLEEAAIDGIPAIIIDPKGDMGNLLLNFPQLSPRDFEPWVDPNEAMRKGMTPREYAAEQASLWKAGLASWQQSPERIELLRNAADVAIYTPGSDAGLPLSVLKSLAPPADMATTSKDMLREQISTAVSGLLTLLGFDADPIRSREHILLTNIVDAAWKQGRSLDLAQLIQEIQNPPFQRIGVMNLETVFPASDRMDLAMTINNILGSPKFAGWMQGEPLDIQKLLYTDDGKPRLAVLSIAHLSDQERMFFVTILLNEFIAWMRRQSGTSSLRALLYMDEVFGYLPPTANPPSKLPMLTLLKQARAFGIGLVLATQNPVDLDYKALSNAGTWFLGRLQTERDKLRVLDGLEGASTAAGTRFDRDRIERILSGVKSRVFLMNNVHDSQPSIFQTRWALSYLRGPLNREQMQTLMADRKSQSRSSGGGMANLVSAMHAPAGSQEGHAQPPVLPDGILQRFVTVDRSVPRDASILYRPCLLATARLHFVDSKSSVDHWTQTARLVELDGRGTIGKDPWDDSLPIRPDELSVNEPEPNSRFEDCPAECVKSSSYRSWGSSLKSFLYQNEQLELVCCPELKTYSSPDDREGDFKARLAHQAREMRDLEMQKLQRKYESKIKTLQDQLERAEDRVAEEKEQANSATMSAMLSFGTTVLGALFGRKKISSTTISKGATSMRSASRAADQRGDVGRAMKRVAKKEDELQDLEEKLEVELQHIRDEFEAANLTVESYPVKPRKSDITVDEVTLVWLPYQRAPSGDWTPAFGDGFMAER
ncbi:MAG: DUF87 domain-containing protein [Planctomycetaceae bacterium]|nr:DUF87 domain-containing protein [Planctomycetaceae bacterium]